MAKRGTAILQFEIDRDRWLGTHDEDISRDFRSEKMSDRLNHIARTAVSDTIRNGGTFVLVSGLKKITLVQRSDADEIDDVSP